VNGGRGFWIEGAPHLFLRNPNAATYTDEPARVAGNTLVWEQGALTLRLESALSREAALDLAESLRPLV
jgi:hypothetical protein